MCIGRSNSGAMAGSPGIMSQSTTYAGLGGQAAQGATPSAPSRPLHEPHVQAHAKYSR